jgi:hypothetical protein
MIQRIGNDVVFGCKDCGDSAGIGGEARLEHYAGFGILELRNVVLQLHVDTHGAGDRPNGTRSSAEFLGCLHCGLHQLGMVGEAEVIVAGEVDHLAAIEAGDRLARRFEHAQALVSACFAPGLELLG